MSQEEPRDLSALDSLFSRYGQGGTRGLSEARKKQIYAGTNLREDSEHSNPTHKTLKAILDYEETIPDQEVDEFVTKIRDTRLLDDYPDDELELSDTTTAPAYNPFPLDEDTSSTVMADPLSGEILVTDLNSQEKTKPEEDPAADPTAESDIDDEEAEDLTAEFEKEEASVSSDHHGDGDTKNNEDGDWSLIPRIDDDVDKGQSVTMDDVVEEEKEEEEEEKEEEEEEADAEEEKEEDEKEEVEQVEDEIDSSADAKDNEQDSRTNPVKINVESSEGTLDKTDASDDVTAIDGKTSEPEGNAASKLEKSPQKKKEDVPDFETFLAELGVDPKETLDVEVQKSRARLSRVGPLAQRRPMTKRFSGGEEDGSKWMFVDSTQPKPQRLSIDEEEEEEEEKVPVKAPAPQPASKPGMKKPAGGIGLGPMVLPGLGAALGGSKLKKTPTSTPNKTFQKSVEESKVTASKSEPTRTPLSSLKKTPPPASKAPPTTATKPLLNKPKPLAKPRPVSQVTPTKEPSQPAWLKELKSKPKPEVKETKKEEEKLNSDILHPKTNSSETTPKTPSWMANSKTKKLPPIPSSSSTPKQEVESSTSNVPQWKQELMKKKKAPAPAPSSVTKSPVKVQILPKSPSKSPAKPPIARKPDFSKQGEGTDKSSLKPLKQDSVDKDSPKPDRSIELKREEENRDEIDSKKLKLSQSAESTQDEEKMEVTLEVSTDEKNKDNSQGKDVQMQQEEKEEEKEEEVKLVKTEEKKVIIIAKEESEKEESKPIKTEEDKVPLVTKNDVSKETVKEKEDEGKNNEGGIDLAVKKDEKQVEKPVIIIPKPTTDKPKIEKEETSKVKSVTIVTKTDSKKEEPKEERKEEDKKVTIVMKSDTKTEEPKKMEQKTVTIVTEDKKNASDVPQWKREARERMQKRKMSGGNIVPLRSPKDTIETNSNNNTPQWKKDLVEKRKMFPKMPSLENEEKGSFESQKSEKALKRHTIAADVPTITVPAGHKTGTPTWKQELEKKNARLAKHLANKDAGPEIKPPIEGVTQQPVPELS